MFPLNYYLFAISVLLEATAEATPLTIPEGRIVGGDETTIDKFPFQASFRMYGYHRCGAVIIRSDVALSAAHCVDGHSAWSMSVKAGITDQEEDGGLESYVDHFIVHEDFTMLTLESDLALLFLEKEFEFSETLQPIALARTGEELVVTTKAYVSGWGTIVEDGQELSDKLRFITVSIWNYEECKDAYDGISNVTATMLCAGELFGGRDPCAGDSGGPLMVGNKLFGTVSWGLGCARAGKPTVYVKIAALRPWLETKLKKKFEVLYN